MSFLEDLARKQLKAMRTKGKDKVGVVPMQEWIPRITPKYVEPVHLKPLTSVLEGWRESPFNIVVSTPPRHGKTETILHYIAWVLAHDPTITIAYVSYQEDIALSKSRKAQAYALAAGVELATRGVKEWRTLQGGGLLATGIGGPLTGHGVQILLVDDPVKNRAAAESTAAREGTWEWFNDVAFTRIEPGGSCAVIQTRWHDDDLAGRLIKTISEEAEEVDGHAAKVQWQNIHLRAIEGEGAEARALWPERWPIPELLLKKAQVGEYGWASLYQGEPVPRGMSLFKDPAFYDELPTEGWRHALGVDLAYTARTKADYSVYVRMVYKDPYYYIADVCRVQETAPQFKARIGLYQRIHRGIPTRFYCAGVELGAAEFFAVDGVNLGPERAYADKFVRAQHVAAAWNDGKVLLPKEAPWLDLFLSEVTAFSGVGDLHDDQVDALAAAYDLLAPHAPANRLRRMANAG